MNPEAGNTWEFDSSAFRLRRGGRLVRCVAATHGKPVRFRPALLRNVSGWMRTLVGSEAVVDTTSGFESQAFRSWKVNLQGAGYGC